jgi:hypothetical protein
MPGSRPACYRLSALLLLYVSFISLTACQAVVVSPTLVPTVEPSPTSGPTATPLPPAGVFWVDLTRDQGELSKFVLGVNHGPWSDFSLDSFKKTIALGVTFMRWPGGNWGDRNDIRSLMIDNYIAQARTIGAEPSISVRVPGSTPARAAEIVRYANLTKGYAVKYWNIGNEPNLYENDPGLNIDEKWTPQRYARVWREFALAMRAVDPGILFYGPDISQFVDDPQNPGADAVARAYLTEFLKVNGDLVNIVTVHRYPFPACLTCGNPDWEDMRANTAEWDQILVKLRRVIRETTGKELPVGVTEYNSNYSSAAGAETSPDSFYSALWLADVYGRLLRQQPELLAYWQIKNNAAGYGLLTSFDVRPSYYSFVMWKKFGNHLLFASTDAQYVSVYAARAEDGRLTVMLINLNATPLNQPLQLKGGDQLQLVEAFLFDATHPAEALPIPNFTNGAGVTLPPESVTLLIFR